VKHSVGFKFYLQCILINKRKLLGTVNKLKFLAKEMQKLYKMKKGSPELESNYFEKTEQVVKEKSLKRNSANLVGQ